MKPLFSKAWLIIVVVIFVVTGCEEPSQETSWGWKRATAPDDVMNFLNKKPPYTQNIKRAEITAVNKGAYIDFIAFYQSDQNGDEIESWGWKRATAPDDVMNFLNKKPPYTQNIKRAEITAVNKGAYIDFIIFYQTGEDNNDIGWGWKKSTNEDDVKAFLSGEGSYSQPIVLAEVVAVSMPTHTEFYIFYTR